MLARSLSVSAEPFGNPSQPVPLDLLHLPRGLESLELRHVDIITPPALLAAAAGAVLQPEDGMAGTSAAAGPAERGSQVENVLGQLECFKLESCRLRTPQLQVCWLYVFSVTSAKQQDWSMQELCICYSFRATVALGQMSAGVTRPSNTEVGLFGGTFYNFCAACPAGTIARLA